MATTLIDNTALQRSNTTETTDVYRIPSDCRRTRLSHTIAMESSPKIGCIVRNEKDPYQMQCIFSTDPGDKRDFSVYFHSPDGKQEIMASCTHNEGYQCIFAHQGLTLTEDYISVSETFSTQKGNFVCRDAGPALEQFPCFYSGNSVKPEVKCGMTDVGPNTLPNSVDFGTEDNNLTVIIGALCGVVIVIQFVVIGFLLWKVYKFKKDHELIKRCILNSDQVIIRRREEGRSIWGESDMISKPDFLPFYKEENSSLIEDPFAEKSKSCNEEPEETKECKHTNRETISQGDLLRFPEKESTLLNQDPFDEKSTSCNGEPGETKEWNKTNTGIVELIESLSVK